MNTCLCFVYSQKYSHFIEIHKNIENLIGYKYYYWYNQTQQHQPHTFKSSSQGAVGHNNIDQYSVQCPRALITAWILLGMLSQTFAITSGAMVSHS